MKKLDKLIIQAFIGPFILTFLVAVFILLIQYMLKYFDDFIGKDLGVGVFGELMMYFSVNMVPMALPLAILVSSLMTYGKLGEHFELTAIKSAGISLPRVLLPTFIFTIFIAIGAFFLNNHLVPQANLRAYSLLYDIKQQKPALDLKEGQFYSGIPNYSIKARKKHKDGITMSDVIIYDHANTNGNRKVILADSCRMYTFANDRYLMMELFRGNYYVEEDEANAKNEGNIPPFIKTKYSRMDLVFSLSSFDLDRTDMDLFAGNRYMKSVKELTNSIDSMSIEKSQVQFKLYNSMSSSFRMIMGGYVPPSAQLMQEEFRRDSVRLLKFKQDSIASYAKNDSLKIEKPESVSSQKKNIPRVARAKKNSSDDDELYSSFSSTKKVIDNREKKKLKNDTLFINPDEIELVRMEMDSFFISSLKKNKKAYNKALSGARGVKTLITSSISRQTYFDRSIDAHVVEKYKKYAQAFACIVMFLIGAPLGSIIKRGGLGMPVIVGVIFFIIFFVFTSASDKWAKAGVVDGMLAAWIANMVLIPFGVIFMVQAWKDAKLFDTDFYGVILDRLKSLWESRKAWKSKLSMNG